MLIIPKAIGGLHQNEINQSIENSLLNLKKLPLNEIKLDLLARIQWLMNDISIFNEEVSKFQIVFNSIDQKIINEKNLFEEDEGSVEKGINIIEESINNVTFKNFQERWKQLEEHSALLVNRIVEFKL
ncbi:MAG: hypothetical protein Q8K60_05530 [Parachlamydiaceae bacterium]|nr:hypothetical protein [Parachlamydiaceae bacterium]